MGYVFDFHDAQRYEQWLEQPANRQVLDLQVELMLELLAPRPGESVLDIGCGSGASTRPLVEKGLSVTGIDPSPYMLDAAAVRLANRVDLYRGTAEDLPFDDNSFHYACFFTTLEFVDDPRQALAEAFRVAKDKVFVGFLNRFAIQGVGRRLAGIFSSSIYNRARFFSVWQIKRMARELLGDVPVQWRTVCQLPGPPGKLLAPLERSSLVQRCPFGTFAGVVVTLVPRLRTRPLAIRYQPKQTTEAVVG